jgi:hypothetical protein
VTPAIALLVIGGILLKAGWKNQNILDVALGREDTRSGGSVPDVPDVPHVPDIPDAPGIPTRAHGGTTNVGGKPVANWIAPILAYARKHGWQGTVTSGYRSTAEQAQIVRSGNAYPVAAPGHSNHQFTVYPGGAVDVDPGHAAQLSRILRHSPYAHLLVWAESKDPVHFSHPHNGGY